jgi:hypothetical protein
MSMKATTLRVTLALGLALGSAQRVVAQDARLTQRLDATTAYAVSTIVDSARAAGLPTEPLVQKALEGASKRASGEQITSAVRRLHARLATARSALGAGTAEAELVAAAAVLDLGASDDGLRGMRELGTDRSLAGPLVGLAYLIQRGVAPEASLEIVRSMVRAKLTDTEFVALQRLVDQDIRAGAPAADAASMRARALIQHGPGLRTRGGGQP